MNRHISPRSPLAVNIVGVKPIPEVTKRPTTGKARNVSNSNAPVQVQNQRQLTLKQLRELIIDIYTCKKKHDEKTFEAKQQRETMEQYMYTYLN